MLQKRLKRLTAQVLTAGGGGILGAVFALNAVLKNRD
jgi:hypothetical protein